MLQSRLRFLLVAALAFGASMPRLCLGQQARPSVKARPDTATSLLNNAYEDLRRKEYDAAIAKFRRVLAMDPKRAELHREIAYTCMKMGETEQAIEAFEAYERVRPGEPRNQIELAYLYHQTKREQQALELFRRVSRSKDVKLAAQARQAYESLEAQMVAEIASGSQAVAADPASDGKRELLAEAYARHNEPGEAIEQYLANRKLKAARYPDLIRLAQLYAETGDTARARGYYLLASRMPDPRVAEMGRQGLGGRYPYASEFEAALALEPFQQQVRRELGYLYITMKQPPAAARHFEQVMEREPADFQSLAQLGFLYAELNRKTNAFRALDRVRREAPSELSEKAAAAMENLGTPAELAQMAAGVTPRPDPVYALVAEAYELMGRKEYDAAVERFGRALAADPKRVNLHSEIGFACLKMGEAERAVAAFEAYERARPGDAHNTLQLAYLYMQTAREQKGLEYFERVEKGADPALAKQARESRTAAEQPLLAEIARWSQAVEQNPNDDDNRELLADSYARHRDLQKAIEQYRELRRRAPARYRHLVSLATLYQKTDDAPMATAYYLLASRCPEPRTAEAGRQGLNNRYPFASEFEKALEQEPSQAEVRRELGYLYLTMKQPENAARHFETIVAAEPNDYQSAAQLGFIYAGLERRQEAIRLLERVRREGPADLAQKAGAVLRQLGSAPPADTLIGPVGEPQDEVARHKQLGYASIQKNYLQAAAREFEEVYKLNPKDFQAIMQLGYLYNVMKRDDMAIRWFKLARESPDAKIAAEARRAVTNLSRPLRRVISTFWVQPFISSRWNDVFGYGQLKTEYRIPGLPFKPYLSLRFIGDTRTRTGGALPQIYSEEGVIASAGLVGRVYKNLFAWGEAGNQITFLRNRPPGLNRSTPDYRGGLSYGQVLGPKLFSKEPGGFADVTNDAVYLSRYDHNAIFFTQTKYGYQFRPWKGFSHQPFLAANVLADARGDYYNNFAEVGPGYRFGFIKFSRMNAYVALIRGAFTTQGRRAINSNRGPNYWDLRVMIWYAKSF